MGHATWTTACYSEIKKKENIDGLHEHSGLQDLTPKCDAGLRWSNRARWSRSRGKGLEATVGGIPAACKDIDDASSALGKRYAVVNVLPSNNLTSYANATSSTQGVDGCEVLRLLQLLVEDPAKDEDGVGSSARDPRWCER